MAPASTRRRVVALVLGLVLVEGTVFLGVQEFGCPDPFVRYDYYCTIPNELIVMTNGAQDRTDIETAVAPSGGQIVIAVEEAGVYSVRFPVARHEELVPIREALVAAGFSVSFSHMGELFARR